MMNILVSGYYGFDNAGDEAILYSIVKSFDFDANITVLSNNPEKTKEVFKVNSANRWNFIEIIREIKKCDIFISGGGSLLQDVTSNKNILYYLSLVYIAKLFGKKVVFYSQGIGPVNLKYNKFLMNYVVKKVDKIYVREKFSKENLISYGINKDKIEVSIDPVIGLDLELDLVKRGKEILENETNMSKENNKFVGVYIRDWKVKDDFEEQFKTILEYLMEKGYVPVFIPMHYPHDIKVSEKVNEILSEKHTIIKKCYSAEEIMAVTANLDFVIGMRLHAVIMAAAVDVPFIGIAYDPKVDYFVEEIGVSKSFDAQKLKSDEVIEYLDGYLNILEEEKEKIRNRKKELVHRAKLPMEYIKKISQSI